MRFALPLSAFMVALIALVATSGPARAASDRSEPPRSIANGIAPTFIQSGAEPLLFWQEASDSRTQGQAWIVRSRRVEGKWISSRIAGPLDFRGAVPILYSVAVSRDGSVGLAIAVSGSEIAILLSHDAGASFTRAGTVRSDSTAVAPRLFPNARGGWILFVTQPIAGATPEAGNPASSGTAAATGAPVAPGSPAAPGTQGGFSVDNTNSIQVAHSEDGASWSAFSPLVANDEALVNNYLPFSLASGDRDLVVFQHQVNGSEDAASHYALYSKASLDGGATWSKALLLTEYQEPGNQAAREVPNHRYFDNQAPRLIESGGKLHIAWQRRDTRKRVEDNRDNPVRVVTSTLDAGGKMETKDLLYISDPASSFILADFLDDAGRTTALYIQDQVAANEVWRRRMNASGAWAAPEAMGFTTLSDPARRGATSFAYAVTMAGRLYALWQYDDQVGTRNAPLVRQRVFLLEPVLHVDPPAISVPNYVAGRRSRDEQVTVRLRMPETSAGIAKVVSLWKRSGDAMLEGYPGGAPGRDQLWLRGTVTNGSPGSLTLPAPEDGAWALAVSVEDNAGNRSAPATLTWFRDRTPPDPPIILPPSLDARGSLLSNSADITWLPPLADDTQGYTWTLVGPLDLAGITNAARRPDRSVIEGQSPIEAAIIERYGLPRPPPAIQGNSSHLALDNIDDGYWLLSVAAIDGTANISDISTVLFRADKQVPFTLVTDIRQTTDLIGRRSLSIVGRGFTDQGSVARVVLTKSRAEPWDFRREAATGGFRISTNRLIEEVAVEDIPEGEYWLGIQHPLRGMYWAPRRVTFDATGTLKYGIEYEYRPSWTLAPQPSSRYSIYDFIVAAAWIFFGLGIFLSLWQAVATLRDAQSVRLQVLALVGGGPMPDAVKDKAIRKAAVRGGGLTLRFTFFIAILILMVVLLVAFSLGISMVRNQSAALARGLEDATRVLLESAAQGGRFFLDREGAVTQLGFLPTQVKALPGAEYITITGNSQDPKVAGRDIVFSTNDPAIAGKISSSRLELGVSPMNLTVDPLASKTPDMARELETKSAEALKGDLDRKAELQKQKAALPAGTAGDEDRKRLNASLDEIDRTIRDRLRAISDEAVDSVPSFDPTVLSQTASSYLFFKPILEYRPGDTIIYRGMVRLSANTALIVADVAARTKALILSTAQIAALVLLGGILGAFFLARSIVRPIREIVAKIDTMRTTEDKASLAGFDIVVRGRDEIATLALAAKALAVELVEGAKQSHALIEGSDIQNHFIPLLKEGTITLSIAKESGKYHEMYGYYKGAKKVSGDYWNFEKLDAEGKYYYFIKCDVSGKDVAAAFIMVQVGTIVINHFNEWQRLQRIPDFELVKLTYRVNDFLVARDYKGKFAAFTIGVINLADGSIQLCHAGDNMYRVWKASTGTTVSAPFQPDLRKSSPATGLIPQDMMELGGTGFYSYRRTLERGDILLLYSDGMEDPIHRFRDASGVVRQCAELPGAADMDHKGLHHDPGDAEHLGPERLDAFIEAYDKREVFSLRHDHETDRDLVMSFDFTKATGALEERLISYLGVGKVFSIYDWNAGDDATILVDRRIDKFLSVFFDQYSLVFRKKESITVKTGRKDREGKDEIVEDPNYFLFRGIREDEQYDDLSIVGISRK